MRRRTRGYTVLELIATGALMGAILVPALAVLRDSIELGREIETKNALLTFCVSKMEEHLMLTAATFSTATQTGDFTTEGYPELRFSVVRSDNPLDGGLSGQMMAVTATVWHDEDGDTVQGPTEPSISLGSKVAKMVVYEGEAT